ncbi:MAG: HAD family hydrolase [Desulfohalobiaceae bacterium]
MSQALQALIFDFDGTLAELNIDFSRMRKGVRALQEAFLPDFSLPEDGWPILEKVEEIRDILQKMQPGLGLEFASRCRLLITALEMDAARQGKLFPYSLEILRWLTAQGLVTAIVTRNCSAAVRQVLPDVHARCGVFLAREDVPKAKPHPSHVQAALDTLKVPAERCLLVGDHFLDIQAARDCKVASAAVATGRLGLQELRKVGPDYCARDLPELMRRLQEKGVLSRLGI